MDLGAEVVLHGDDYDQAHERALVLERERNLVFIHPFDDPDVIAGQGTIAMEILRQRPGDIHAIFVPVGGGGLITGIAAYTKYLYPRVKVIGVRTRGRRGHARLAQGPQARDARARRHLRRRRGGAARGRGNVPAGARARRRGAAGQHRPDLRRDPGHLRGHARDRRARGRARGRRHQALRRARKPGRRDAGGGEQRRQHELRPPAPHRRALRSRRAARSADGGGNPGAAGELPQVLRGAGAAQRHRVQLPLREQRARADLRRLRLVTGARGEGGGAAQCREPRASRSST